MEVWYIEYVLSRAFLIVIVFVNVIVLCIAASCVKIVPQAHAAVLQLKSLEAFAKAADGKVTKIIIPSEIQGIAGLAKLLTEVAEKERISK